MMDDLMCEDCQKKFDEQQGQLRLLDMCQPCKVAHAIVILSSIDEEVKETDNQ